MKGWIQAFPTAGAENHDTTYAFTPDSVQTVRLTSCWLLYHLKAGQRERLSGKLSLEKHFILLGTDGARVMTGERKGCIAILKERDVITVHCIIHQENLCSKQEKIEIVMLFVEKTVNFINTSSLLKHRQFGAL